MSERAFNYSSFQQYLNEHRLMASRCRSTGEIFLPPRPLNPTTHTDDMEWVEVSGKGRLLAFTTVHIAPSAMIEAGYDRSHPYCTGIVELEEGPRISAQILGVDATKPEEIAIGAPLQAAFVERGAGEEKRAYLAFERAGDS